MKLMNGTKEIKENRLKIKLLEIMLSAVMTIHGVGMIVTNDFEYRGFPIPEWAAYTYALAGISILPLAWFLRSRKK